MNLFSELGLTYLFYIYLKDYNLHEKTVLLKAKAMPGGGIHVTMAVKGELTPKELELYDVVETEILAQEPDVPIVDRVFIDYSNRLHEFPQLLFHQEVNRPPGLGLRGLED